MSKATQQNVSATLNTSILGVKGEDVPVFVVCKGDGNDVEKRFYLSPMIAQTALEDINKGEKLLPVFQGRSESEMIDHLVKTALPKGK